MRIIYDGNRQASAQIISEYKTFIYLGHDNWNDFGHQTFFSVMAFKDCKNFDLGSIRIMTNASHFNQYMKKNVKNTYEEIGSITKYINKDKLTFKRSIKYISLPVETDFYDKLIEIYGLFDTKLIMKDLHDAGYVIHKTTDIETKSLLQDTAYKESLLRDLSSTKSYEESWRKIFRSDYKKEIEKADRSFDVITEHNNQTLRYKFNFRKNILPNEINILIGPNGTGKTALLKNIVELSFQSKNKNNDKNKLENFTGFSDLIYFSYSPFEDILKKIDHNIFNSNSYSFFGLTSKNSPTINTLLPNKDSIESIISILRYDKKNIWFTKESKFNFWKNTIKKCIDFDKIYIKSSKQSAIGKPTKSAHEYIEITHNNLNTIDNEAHNICYYDGLLFSKNNDFFELSSGQKMFTYITSCLAASIKNNSIILFDEPELYLHPSMELILIDLLKILLNHFEAYAIIATHSLIIAREIPKHCTQVINKDRDGYITIQNPPFQSFGASMLKICTNVFNDIESTKPHQKWIWKQFIESKQYSTDDIDRIIDILGPESTSLIKSLKEQ